MIFLQGILSAFFINMKFYSIKDFYENKELHQIKYLLMTKKQQKAYKRYVYSICFSDDNIKDAIWEYLNYDENSKENITKQYNKKFGGNNEIS